MTTGNQSFSIDDFAKALEAHDYDLQKGQIVTGRVFEYDSNGAYIEIKGGKSPGFLPMSEISFTAGDNLSEILPLGEEQEFLIIRDQNSDGQVLLSLRKLQVEKAWDHLSEISENSESLQVVVTGVNRGGVTVDADCLRGFIPRSHLLVRDNLEALVGETITVTVLEFNRDREKLVLSQRMASQSVSFSQLQVGQLVEGTVGSIKPFGVFIELEGVTGLIHIKEVSQKYVGSLPDIFTIGQTVKALVISLEEGRQRVSLSTRLLENYPGEIVDKFPEVMDSAEARAERARKLLTA
ncbi:S1 RNA-binding domain-containing protein [Limnospira fusiformis KN01]|uniref:RNA binding S1 domain protein n=2 Tax=Limnospira TaxID=2596745 RepID=B5VV11_LIMMA|nr:MULTISPECIES: S1 RNA-binding domain-containing protein [Limnospira]EKD11440.1 30S ribosomal protein S1 [Arthrospira platensis C1]MDY7055057.1 S1 RNA-binding domain-containing protein [Limnospira fusiformis LS22]QJB27609.1 30S ribosomal protein S1 [Limnospira fusiformis SAG 85.79]EDZ96854.1 RNA binding S1 domain protein [Limnospira maxima CS-328]MDT9187613.1 S1 RNA-binding domain-containing protein [Limnospira sp. PMC 894.15]